MIFMLRFLLAFVVAALVALPVVGSEGGDQGGGTGIWILPCASHATWSHGATPVDQKALPSLASDLYMQVSANCGACSATLVDDLTGVPVSLPVIGKRVLVSASLMQALAAGGTKASILILDAAGNGYSISLTATSTGGAVFRVY